MTTYIFLGDSLTHGYGVPEGQGWVDLLAHDLAFKGSCMENHGKDGDTLQGMYNRLERILSAQVRAPEPYKSSGLAEGNASKTASILCLLGGTNDILMGRSADYCFKKLQGLVGLWEDSLGMDRVDLISQGRGLVVALLPPLDYDPFDQNPILEAYNAKIRSYAENRGLALIDFYTPLKEASDFGLVVYEGDVHPNSLGYKIMYQAAKELLLSL
ncbi:MAG: hypothetical protein KIA66_03285 [Veillonella sp.]|jgi:GDSL-like protein|nr:hypothetical protein [Veillonella sp.]